MRQLDVQRIADDELEPVCDSELRCTVPGDGGLGGGDFHADGVQVTPREQDGMATLPEPQRMSRMVPGVATVASVCASR